MNRCASSYGNGSIKTLSITLKIAVDAPIPNANVTMATSAKPRLFQSVRAAYRISCRSVSTSILPPLANAVANLDSASPAISVTVACGCQPQSEQNSTVHLSTGQLTGRFLHSATESWLVQTRTHERRRFLNGRCRKHIVFGTIVGKRQNFRR